VERDGKRGPIGTRSIACQALLPGETIMGVLCPPEKETGTLVPSHYWGVRL
jgi:hypothetical protein